ncbi:MAG: hypothetical protein FJX30_01925 [Alphaproteobacteria bacterium]|nr:hypothetical protein [Alphaproteobacteria bacterium]
MLKVTQILVAIFLITYKNSFAQETKNNIYEIESISSKASDKTPNASKILATTNARRDAFMVLLMRLQLPIATADNISNEEIAEMVRSEQIVDEKIAGNNYSANYNITFARDFVDHILEKKTKEQESKNSELDKPKKDNYLIIPIKVAKKRPILWEPENDWRSTIDKVINKNNLQKNFIIPESNAENIALINGQNISNISFENFEKILETYKAQGVYLMFYNFDEIENKVLVEVQYFRKLLKKQFRLSFINVDRLSYSDLLTKVADRSIEYLKNNPIGSDNALNKNIINLIIKISSISDWLNVKNTLDKSSLIDGLEIISISKDEVKIKINYINTQIPVEQGLEKLGLIFSKRNQDTFDINAISQ